MTALEYGIPFEWALQRKKKYIASLLGDFRTQINQSKRLLAQCNETERQLIEKRLKYLEKEFNKNKNYLDYLNNPERDENAITDEEIEIARNYPIQEFLPADYRGRGNIKCLFHDDKQASCQVNLTFLYCHTCGKKWDAIDLYQHFNGADFKSTVKTLARS